MTTAEQPTGDQSKAEDIPLEDIDKLLEAEDPEFTKSLDEVRAVENNKDISLEATIIPDDDQPEVRGPRKAGWFGRMRARVRLSLYTMKLNAKARLKTFAKDAFLWLKVRPKEYALYSFILLKILFKKIAIPLKAFRYATLAQKLGALLLCVMVAVAAWVLLNNLRGIWLPLLNEPILTDLSAKADAVEDYDLKEGGESFYSAFPQERYEYLFDKMKVNLRRTSENANPMGAFEVIVLLDSKDTAIEVRDRKIEFFDALQRVFEDESVTDLEGEIGKTRLKGRLKRELNQKLTQGWVKDINFQTFILKP